MIIVNRMTNFRENYKMRLRNAETLQEKLKATEFTQTELAKLSGLTRATLWNIRKGLVLPTIATINKIEEVLK